MVRVPGEGLKGTDGAAPGRTADRLFYGKTPEEAAAKAVFACFDGDPDASSMC